MKSSKIVNYEKFKKEALTFEPVQRKVPLSNLEVDNSGNLSVSGTQVRTVDGIVERQLLRQMLKLQPQLLNKMEKVGGEKAKKQFIDLVKLALSFDNVKTSEVTVVGNPKTGIITNILPGDKDVISNRMALKLFEDAINKGGSDLEVINTNFTPGGGISLNVKKGEIIDSSKVRKLKKGEEFNPGFSFKNEISTGISVNDYVTRLVCTNGMVGQVIKGAFNIQLLSDDVIRKFFEEFEKLKNENFINYAYASQIEKAISNRASFGEIMAAREAIVRNSEIKYKDTVSIGQFLPEFNSVAAELARKGVDYADCSDQQLKNYPTKYNVWDVVNRVTDFGSHDYGFEKDGFKIQEAAGELFNKKTYDTQNLILF